MNSGRVVESALSEAPPARPAPAPELAVVIINYKSGAHLRKCLKAFEGAAGSMATEVVVVDNASQDDSLEGLAEEFPGVVLIQNEINSGYARACNKGIDATTAPFVCFLNPDTVPSFGSLAALMKKMAVRPSAGAVGPRIRNADGTLYPSCRVVPTVGVALGHAFLGLVWPTNPFSRTYKLLDWDHRSERQVDWISGAAMLVRRNAFTQVGGFDEGFFMYVEDVELCDRLRKAGWSILYEPQAEMIHHRAGSSHRAPYRMIRHHHFSLIRYMWNKSKRSPKILLFPVIALGIFVRMVLCWLGQLFATNGRNSPGATPDANAGRASNDKG